MKLEFNANKRAETLKHRGLDFADSVVVFAGPTLTVEDTRQDYGETRHITIGYLETRMVVLVWSQRGDAKRIISMRKANDREQQLYGPKLG